MFQKISLLLTLCIIAFAATMLTSTTATAAQPGDALPCYYNPDGTIHCPQPPIQCVRSGGAAKGCPWYVIIINKLLPSRG